MEKGKIKKINVILYGICAVIWTARAVLEIAYRTYDLHPGRFILNIVCALIWIAAFAVCLKRYRENGEE